MSKIQVDAIEQQTACGTTLTAGGGAGKTVVVDATTVTLGRCGGTVALASGASQTGFGRTGTVDWQTGSIKTATFTAANGEGYFANTSGGAFTMNLPAGVVGNIVSVVDYTNTFQTNSLTISPNGSEKIGGANANATLNTKGQSVTFVYVDGTEGWKNVQDSTSNIVGNIFLLATGGTVTTSGNCKIHTFTGPDTFTVSAAAQCAANNVVSYLVVAGGGGGSGSHGGGAGGGGFREYRAPTQAPLYTASPLNGNPCGTAITVTTAAFPITVGGGGAAGPESSGITGGQGSTSTFSTVSSAGGGGGANYACGGTSGGSGGGGKSPAGAGNTPPVTPPQGSNGGTGPGALSNYGVGGGGGATEVGQNAPGGSASGRGGAGATTSISGSPLSYSGGGGSGTYSGGTAGSGSPCGTGGAAGSPGGDNPGIAGTINRGGGSGGRSYQTTGGDGTAGGSGIVIIRYKFQ